VVGGLALALVTVACVAPVKPEEGAGTTTTSTSTTTTIAPGLTRVVTQLGCADGLDAASLDRFFAGRVGPVLGWDYPHVLPIGPDRWLWLFQDVFVDHAGAATDLGAADFVHNAAVVQSGRCFTLIHGGTTDHPHSFALGPGIGNEPTDEEKVRRWWWPLGSAVDGDVVRVFWVEMRQDQARPPDAEGLPYAPSDTWLGTYRLDDLSRVSFEQAPDDGVKPIYGYGVVTDDQYSYLFGNSYLQDFWTEGGFWGPDHSATRMFVARVPKGQLDQQPEYWTGTRWAAERDQARPFSNRWYWENPMQPVLIDGLWLSTAKENGFFSERIVVERATRAQGAWQLIRDEPAVPRGGDTELSSTYHAYPLPWLDGGNLIVALSSNAWNMRQDAYPRPELYRPQFLRVPLEEEPPTTTTTTTVPPAAQPSAESVEPAGPTPPPEPGPAGRDLSDEARAAGLIPSG
jgi:hypothetical protein